MKRVHVREAEGIFKIEVPDNVRKIVIVKAQVHGVMTYITPLFFANFFHTLLNIILVSNNNKSTISFSILIYLPICAILLSSYFNDLVYYCIGDIKYGHENFNFLNGFVFIIFFMFNAW
jgi:hypothetical protein